MKLVHLTIPWALNWGSQSTWSNPPAPLLLEEIREGLAVALKDLEWHVIEDFGRHAVWLSHDGALLDVG